MAAYPAPTESAVTAVDRNVLPARSDVVGATAAEVCSASSAIAEVDLAPSVRRVRRATSTPPAYATTNPSEAIVAPMLGALANPSASHNRPIDTAWPGPSLSPIGARNPNAGWRSPPALIAIHVTSPPTTACSGKLTHWPTPIHAAPSRNEIPVDSVGVSPMARNEAPNR